MLEIYQALCLFIIYFFLYDIFPKEVSNSLFTAIVVLSAIVSFQIYSISRQMYDLYGIFLYSAVSIYTLYLSNKYMHLFHNEMSLMDYLYIILFNISIIVVLPAIIALINIFLFRILVKLLAIIKYLKKVLFPDIFTFIGLIVFICIFIFGILSVVSSSLSYGILGFLIIGGIVLWLLEILGLNK